MMIKRSLQFLAPVVLVVALGACGSDSKKSDSTTTATAAAGSTVTDATASAGGSTVSSAPGAGSEFCKVNADIDDALSGAADATAGLAVLKQLEPKFDDYLAKAPAGQKASVTAFVDASRKAIAANDAGVLTADEDALAGVESNATYCGYALN